MKPAADCPVAAYARTVVAGEIVAGRLVRLACKRHLDDLEHGESRGLIWNQKRCKRALEFYGLLRLPDSDKPFELRDWQKFVVGSIHGWTNADGYRRFRTVYIEAGKGSGKTPGAAAEGLHGLVADGEKSAEIYTAGVTRDQANYLLADAKKIAEASPALRNRLTILTNNISFDATNSFMRGVSSEARTLDQKRVHIALLDEVHEHPGSLVVDKMRAGTKGRKQALIYMITNAGYDKTSVCWRQHEYAEKVLERLVEDDSLFAYICQLDPCDKCFAEGKKVPSPTCKDCDDWRDEKVWLKTNPSLPVTPSLQYLREQVREAVGMPTKENIVKRLNFCIWTETGINCAIPMDKWRECGTTFDIDELKTLPAFAGLDLGLDSDLSAFVLAFQHNDKIALKAWFWAPESLLSDSRNPRRDQYNVWAKAGFLRVTPGDTVDYDFVRGDINELAGYMRPDAGSFADVLPSGNLGAFDNKPLEGPFYIQSIRVDRLFQAAQISTQLIGDGFKVESFGQGFVSMTAPTKEFLKAIKDGRIEHDNNPVLNWHASNLAVEVGPAGIKPTKEKSGGKIDGQVAAIMATAGIIAEPDNAYVPGGLLDREVTEAF